jgi:uncharacterized lipoprotein YajG
MSMRALFTLLLVTILSGCAVNKMDAQVFPDQDLGKVNSFYVVKHDADERNVNELIVKKLSSLGKQVSTGTSAEAPAQVDALVTYTDKWMWDITMYMIELTIVIQDSKDKFPIAKGYSMHTSLTRLSPEKMVDEVITNIYKKQTK